MLMNVPGLEPQKYAEMERLSGKWHISIDGTLVSQMQDEPMFQALGLNKYRLLGVEPNVGRVIRFADLHRHSDCSLLDGMTKIDEMVAHTEYAGALTDHGNMYGFLEYFKAMNKAGKKPIIGFEGYIESLDGQLKGRHVILLAKNNTGLKNLYKLTSEAYDNFKSKPHVTWAMLRKYHEGVICLSACLSGLIPTALKENDLDTARLAMKQFVGVFGTEDFYVELQRHHIEEENRIFASLRALAKEFNLKVVATTDSHYPTKEDGYVHEIILCLRTKATMDDSRRLKYDGTGYHLMNSEEMETLFADCPEALDNTLELADRCDVSLDLGQVNLPKYDIPKRFDTPIAYMRYLSQKGFEDRYGETPYKTDPVYLERLGYELDMIEQMGFAEYFIIIWDFVNFARKNNIYVGPGRGSAAGSIVAYCLGITDLCPIKYNLMFERFLNPERVSWPDIDMDIEYYRRGEVIQYINRKYGAENVCRIVAFGTEAAKQSVKDVARCLGMPATYGAKLSGMVPKEVDMTIERALEVSPDFQTAYRADADAKRIIDIAKRIEGNRRHATLHACGIVIAPGIVSDYLPTSMELDPMTEVRAQASQVTKEEVEELSLIKMDLLGLKNMGVIHEVIDRVQENYGKETILTKIGSAHSEIRYQDIPLGDRATYKMLAQGITGGVFQMESPGMTRVVTQMLSDLDSIPDDQLEAVCFERLIAAVALYRPGPMDYIPDYVTGLRNPKSVHYDCPEEESILSSTYGVMVYQEQLIQIAQKLAGFSLGRADVIRRGCAKKKKDVLAAEREAFIYGNKAAFEAGKESKLAPGCVGNGITNQAAEDVWEKMVKFASYAFNRSHAACYAYIAYLTAYMSCHWPDEFYAALLNAFIETKEKVKGYLAQADRRNITLLPPDINLSDCEFRAEGKTIRFGLRGISGLKGTATAIVDERRKNGLFSDMQDLYERLAGCDERLGKSNVEGLVYSGALSSLNSNKAALIALYPLLESNYKSDAVNRALGQFSLFSAEASRIATPTVRPMQEAEEMSKECDALGIYLTKHPADEFLKRLTNPPANYRALDVLMEREEGETGIQTVGLIKNCRPFYTKSNTQMCSFDIETKFATMSCIVFPRSFGTCKMALRDDVVTGVVCNLIYDDRKEQMQLVVDNVVDIDVLISEPAAPITVEIHSKAEQDRILSFVEGHPGDVPVCLVFQGKHYPLRCRVKPSVAAIEFLNDGFRV